MWRHASAAGPWPPAARRSIPDQIGLVFFTLLVFAVGSTSWSAS